MQMDYEYDPWDIIAVRKLFATLKDKHPMDAIARRFYIFMEARKLLKGIRI
jgi:hypothetical protein